MQIITVERYLSPPTVFVVKIGTIFNNIKKLRNHVAPNLSMLVYMCNLHYFSILGVHAETWSQGLQIA